MEIKQSILKQLFLDMDVSERADVISAMANAILEDNIEVNMDVRILLRNAAAKLCESIYVKEV